MMISHIFSTVVIVVSGLEMSTPNKITVTNNTAAIPNELFAGYSDELLNIATIGCILFMVIGVPGNILTIFALSRGKQNRNSTAVFIINLSVSDLLFGGFNLPLAASTFLRRAWIHGDLLCRLFPLLRYGLLAVSLFTVSLITINRYVIIAHPRQYTRIYQRRHLALMVVGTWILCFSIMIPTWRGIWGKFGLDTSIGSCSILRDDNNRSPKEFLFLLAFMVPCCCIVFCYTRIFYLVRKAAIRTREPASKPAAAIRASDSKASSGGNNENTKKDGTIDSGDVALRPFSVNEDIEYIDVNYSLENLPISYKSACMPDPSLHSSHETEKSKEPCLNADSNPQTENASRRQNKLKTSIKTSFTRFNPRKNHYVSMVNTSNASAIYPGRMSQKDRRLLKMILVIFVSFVICYLPITLTKIWKGATENHIFNISGYLLVYLTTCINPIIYVLMSSEYRQAYWNLLRCRCEGNSLTKDFNRMPKT
ncbi:G-protein coupled receptor moody isoform X2 [Stomoxys calcitrans]|uniref:G-protein coupled receptor moody isoform X2 n=1 Tax=Stomoxys calcitrans TaxID=35570 RepID=UPI0027E24FBC|nr:G-protein coupled receptor moody isoform X2 [Stomoxys calcitrans]